MCVSSIERHEERELPVRTFAPYPVRDRSANHRHGYAYPDGLDDVRGAVGLLAEGGELLFDARQAAGYVVEPGHVQLEASEAALYDAEACLEAVRILRER